MLQPGAIVDRFTVEELLGEGGMASVYRVRHNALGSLHALKVLKIRDEDVRRRLEVEGQVQANLHHPNIVAVTDILSVNGQPALLMEMVVGPSLEDWLAQHRPTLDTALGLFRGIVAGTARAHRAGLVHRDLKPGNVLLDSHDGLVVPKVTDFGLAKVLDRAALSTTRTGTTMGTPNFMAPEQIRNAKDVDARADVFALGCILYALTCGRRPFNGVDALAIYSAVCDGRYPPPELLAPDLPVKVREVIAGCLAVDRHERIADCDALRAALYGADDAVPSGVRLVVLPGSPRGRKDPKDAKEADRARSPEPPPAVRSPAADRPAPADPMAGHPAERRNPGPSSRVSARTTVIAVVAGVVIGGLVAAFVLWNVWPRPSASPAPGTATSAE
jgi:serine/threonine-protein kinase